MSNVATEATVTTLTAEVRTLVIGTRQVTLSIAKQLDMVPLSHLTVMGRIRLGSDTPLVIGTARDGSLARAKYDPWFPSNPYHYIGIDDIGVHQVTICKKTGGYGPNRKLKFEGINFDINADATELCSKWNEECSCTGWSAPAEVMKQIYDALIAQRQEHQKLRQLNKAAADSPLIVLAGLK